MEIQVAQQRISSCQAAETSRSDRLAELVASAGRAAVARSVTQTPAVRTDRIHVTREAVSLHGAKADLSPGTGHRGPTPVPPVSRLAGGGGVIAAGPAISPGSAPHSTASRPGAVRPLSMAPTSGDSAAAATALDSADQEGSGQPAGSQGLDALPMNASGGSGGGGNPNVDPRVVMSGGYTGVDATGTGSITTPPVSIGTYFDLKISPPVGSSDTLKTVTVRVSSNNPSGYLGVSDYFDLDPNKAPLVNQQLYKNINTNPAPGSDGVAETHFVVDADPATYSVLVQVAYNQHNDSGDTIIGFTSWRPSGNLTLLDQGTTKVNDTNLGLVYNDQGNPNGYESGITLYATTAPISYQGTGGLAYIHGDFTFMQTVQMQNSYAAGGQKFVVNSPDPSTPSFDNGWFGGAAFAPISELYGRRSQFCQHTSSSASS